MLLLRRTPGTPAEPSCLDAVQRCAVQHRGGVLRVLGAPGTGKTTLAVEIVAARVAAGELTPDQCLVLASSRRAAGLLRERVTARVAGTSTEPLARTLQSFGFGLLRQAAATHGDPAPRLLSGPEQDVVLRDLLAGHAAGESPAPDWPDRVRLALPTRAFRAELRDLLMRAVELGLDPGRLADLGHRAARPDWVAAAQLLREYDEVTALSRPGGYDPAWILGAAADLLHDDEAAADGVRRSVRLVVLDDAQELTPAGLRLLHAVVDAGAPDVVLLGDPDAATQTFRGADPRIVAHRWTALGAGPTLTLPTAYRLPETVHRCAAAVTGHVGVLGDPVHRRAAPGRAGGSVEVHLLRAVSQEAALVAGRLRAAHLVEGRPWSDMAVIVRGRARATTLRRTLQAAGVPVSASGADLPVRDEVAVRPLLLLLAAALDLASGAARSLPPDVVTDLLTSPVGAADAVSLRRLRRALRRQELAAGGSRTSDQLLGEAVLTPSLLAHTGPEAVPARRVGVMLAAGRGAAARVETSDGRSGWASAVSAESVLWAMWDASGLAERWRQSALGSGPAAARADRDLDAVLALFDAAATFGDRLPGAGPEGFLDHVRGQDVPGDTLVARAPSGDSVALLTPQAAAGREWPLVVVAGVQEGVWPDLRLRGSLLGSQQLVDVVTGRAGGHRAAQTAVRHDETRLFLVAVTRTSEQLLVTAVRSEDEQPSPLLDVLDPRPAADGAGRPFTDPPRPLTLAGLVGELRREVAGPDPARRGAAVTALARLATAGVPGADPARWWALTGVSDHRPVRDSGASVTVSPSRIEAFTECGLRWLLTSSGGDGPARGAADIGSLVHGVAHDLGDVDDLGDGQLTAAVDERWPRLGMAPGWLGERRRSEAHDMVRQLSRYLRQARGDGWQRVGSEERMRVALGRAVLSGRVDRVEADRSGALRVVDLKTGSTKPKAAEVAQHPQLGSYQLAVERGAFGSMGTRSGGALLVHLGKAGGTSIASRIQDQAPLAEQEDPGWVADLVEDTARGMGASSVTATPGPLCSTCPVRTSCPAVPEGRRL